MKILVTGSTGLVGSRFVELSKFKDSLICPPKESLDITNPDFILPEADVIINFAAYTNVGEGESQRNDKNGLCWKLNIDGVKNLLEKAKEMFLVQISTDLVFSGVEGPYAERDMSETDSSKVTWYGFTKGESERLCQDQTILRVIYPVRAKFNKKLDYIRKPLSLYDKGKLYPMFTDQQVSITFVDETCTVIDKIIEKQARGVFHAGSSDVTNPFELYSYLLVKARGVKDVVKPGSLTEFLKTVNNPVRYPMFSGLKVEKTQKELGIKFSSWREIVDKLVEQGISV